MTKIYTDSWISARRPDIVFTNKHMWTAKLIDIAYAMDTNVEQKELEKM